MTRAPPTPAANHAAYPPIETSNSHDAERADFGVRVRHRTDKRVSTGSPLPVAPFGAAALAGAIGYAVWSERARSADHK